MIVQILRKELRSRIVTIEWQQASFNPESSVTFESLLVESDVFLGGGRGWKMSIFFALSAAAGNFSVLSVNECNFWRIFRENFLFW